MQNVIVISGGSDGLGKIMAKRLSPKHQVVLLANNSEGLAQAAKETNSDFVVCDVANHEQVNRAVSSILEKYQKIDCLINNAGVWIEGALDQNDPERIKAIIDVNTLGVMYLTQAVLPHMKSRMSGRILNIISQAGLYGKAERSVYTASKFAVTGFTKSLQFELARFNIGVTGVYPGKLRTSMFEKAGNKKDLSDALDPDEVAKVIEFICTLSSTTLLPEVGIRLTANI